jgi:hypothetical protein
VNDPAFGDDMGQLDHLLAILQGVPDVVWQDHGGRPDQLKQGVS